MALRARLGRPEAASADRMLNRFQGQHFRPMGLFFDSGCGAARSAVASPLDSPHSVWSSTLKRADSRPKPPRFRRFRPMGSIGPGSNPRKEHQRMHGSSRMEIERRSTPHFRPFRLTRLLCCIDLHRLNPIRPRIERNRFYRLFPQFRIVKEREALPRTKAGASPLNYRDRGLRQSP